MFLTSAGTARASRGALLLRWAFLHALMLVAVGAVVVVPSTRAEAADNGAWSVTPTPPKKATPTPRDYFVLEGRPGSTIQDKVRVQNWTRKPITFKVYGADGYNTAKDGFFALKGLEQPMTDLGAWVRPVTSQVTVYGRTQVDIPVTVTIPQNASPGDHVGGVVAMNVDVESTAPADEGLEVGVQRAVGARMYLRVRGPAVPALEVSDVHLDHDRGIWPWTGEGRGTVSWTVENTGNVRLSGTARVRINAWLGGSTAERHLNDLLPGQRIRVSQAVTGIPAFGRVTASVRLTAPDDVIDQASTTRWLWPWPALVATALAAALAGWWWRRRRRLAASRIAGLLQAPSLTGTDDRATTSSGAGRP